MLEPEYGSINKRAFWGLESGVGSGVLVTVGVTVVDGVKVGVTVIDGVMVGVGVGVAGVGVTVGVTVWVGVTVGVGCGVGTGRQEYTLEKIHPVESITFINTSGDLS